jgi:hypothetical protein
LLVFGGLQDIALEGAVLAQPLVGRDDLVG